VSTVGPDLKARWWTTTDVAAYVGVTVNTVPAIDHETRCPRPTRLWPYQRGDQLASSSGMRTSQGRAGRTNVALDHQKPKAKHAQPTRRL
jgi:hypothetical protein